MESVQTLIHREEPSSHKPYQYDELLPGGYFRYLILQPGADDEPLQCSLHTACLPSEPPYEPFEAISYVWGSDVKDEVILCDGHILNITTNLHKVLQRVRRTDVPRKLWADSICINQDDLEEKGHQVASMGQIYRTAESVLIYIGADDDGHGPLVCSLLEEVNAMIEDTCSKINMSWNSFPFPEDDNKLLTDTRWPSLRILLFQPWFQRGWVVQEAALARHGQVFWGQSEFTWESLMCTNMWLRRRALRTYFSLDFLTCLIGPHYHTFSNRNKSLAQAFFLLDGLPPYSLLTVLQDARCLQLTDPCDRVFAFMGLMLHHEHEIHFYPDYKHSHPEIYRKFAIQYMQTTKDADILNYVIHNTQTLDCKTPSWVPRWDLSLGPISKNTNHPALTSRNKSESVPRLINDATLQVQGVVMDSVQYASGVFHYDTTTPEVIRDVWNSVKKYTANSPYGASNSLDAFLDTLCRGSFLGEWFQWLGSKAAFAADTKLNMDESELRPDSVVELRKQSSIFYDLVRNMLPDTRLIVTKRGYLGIASAVAKEGDACGIIFGCKVPCILRPAADRDHYRYLSATLIIGKELIPVSGNTTEFGHVLGNEYSKDWLEWDVEEQDIYLC